MASTIRFILAPEDEKELFEMLSRYEMTLYPERIPPGYVAPKVEPACLEGLEVESCYLAAENLGPLHLHVVKRGKAAGTSEIDESQSPVIHYERCVIDDEGALRAGRMWMWLDIGGDARRNPAFPDALRNVWLKVRDFIQSRSTKSQPDGWFVGPHAVEAHENGTVLKDAGHRPRVLKPYLKGGVGRRRR